MHFQCIVVEFDAHLLGGELPIHTDLSDITPLGPSDDLAAKCFQIRDAPVEALRGKDAQFDLGDVQPTAMFGCVVDLQAELSHTQDHPPGIGVIDIQQRLDRFGQINRRFGGTYTDLTSSAQRFGDIRGP